MGFMGCGKSTIGTSLAKRRKMKFVDLDEFIEKKQKTSIAQIFDQYGEAHFRKLETKFLKQIVKDKNQVIALGGGTPCFKENRKYIDFGNSIYLMVSIETLTNRLFKAKAKRPLIKKFASKKSLSEFIRGKLKERKMDYSRSRIRIRNNANVLAAMKRIQIFLK